MNGIQTTLVSRLTQDIEDLRQDKQYLRADVTRLQAELQRERREKERYRRRVGELENLLERLQEGNTRGDAHRGSVKLEPFATKSESSGPLPLRKSPSLEIVGFKGPPSPPRSLIDVDLDTATEESKTAIEEEEVDYESQDPNFAYLEKERGELSLDNGVNEDGLDATAAQSSIHPNAQDYEDDGMDSEGVDDENELDAIPQPSEKALGKRKALDDSTPSTSSFKRPRTVHDFSTSDCGLQLPSVDFYDDFRDESPLSSLPSSRETSPAHQQDVPPESSLNALDAETLASSISKPIPPLPFRPRIPIGAHATSLSHPNALSTTSASSAPAPIPPLPFRPRVVRNFKIKQEEAVVLPSDIVANYLQDVPPLSIDPDPSAIPFISRKFLAKVYGGSDRLQYIDVPKHSPPSSSRGSASTSNSTPTPAPTSRTGRRRKRLVFPTPEMNPSMPLFPGDAGLIFTSRTEILKDGPWSVFRKYDRAIDVDVKREVDSELPGPSDTTRENQQKGKGKQKSVVWVYVGDYECTKVGKISREEWGAQNDEVKRRWANRVATKMTSCYLSMRARIGLRKAGIVPGSPPPTSTPSTHTSSPSTSPSPSNDDPNEHELDSEDPDAHYDRLLREEISAHRSRTPNHPITEQDVLEAFESGDEGIDIVQLKCVAYDWEWVRDFEGRWDRGERGKWWEGDESDDGEEGEEEEREEIEGASKKNKKRKRRKSQQGESQVRSARRRSTRTRARGQTQVNPDVESSGALSVNGPVDDRGEATMTVLPPPQTPTEPAPIPESLPSSAESPTPTTRTSSVPFNPSNLGAGETENTSSRDSDEEGKEGGGGEGDIDDGYISYVSDEELDTVSGDLDDSRNELEGCEGGDGSSS